ncbi:MAG TPA: aspartyl protease family protein [Pyrinomonadaceae bacterium]|jgi:tetratricopeptide (TPR) repeat protein
MKFNNFRDDIFLYPFHIRRLLSLFFICLLFAASTIAAEDIQQAAEEESVRLTKQAEKISKKGDFAEAEKLFRRAIEVNPRASAAKLKLAYLLFKQRRLIEAYDLSYAVAKAEPKNSYAFAVLGITLLNAGNFKDARTSIYNAINLNKKEALAWAGLGMLDFYENRINQSLNSLYESVYYEPNEPDFIFTFAQVAARAEKYKEAAEAYRKFLSVSEDSDKERRDRIKGLIGFLNYLGNKQSLYLLDGDEKSSVNFNLTRNRPVIELKVNNKDEPLKFVLDTGSGISVISDETAERLKIKPVARGGFARGIGGDGKFEIVYGFLRSVDIGAARIKNVPVYIRKFHNDSEKVDGYIGLSLISKFLTTIDYGGLTFSLIRKNSIEKAKFAADELSLPLRLTSSGFLSGEVQLEGVEVPLNFIVDTGASVSVISDDLAGSQEISNFAKGEKMRVIGAAGVTEDVPSFLLPRVTFGTHSRESITAVALDLDLINETSGFQQAGILGGNFLKNYSLTFDFQNSKVIFVPNKK